MSFYGYNEDAGEHYSTSYGHHFGAASQYSSPYDPVVVVGEPPNLIDYTSPAYYTDDYSASAYSPRPVNYNTCSYDYSDYSVNQSEAIYSQLNYLQYDPPPHYQTKFTVSYSTVEVNEPEFPEYDLTPYDGGYDQTMTYGKPIPPSDLTCYPRSLPQSDAPPQNFDLASIPSPYGKDDDHPPIKPLPPIGSIPTDTKAGTGRDSNVFDSIPSPHGKDHLPPIDAKPETGRDSSHVGGKVNNDGEDVEPKDVISSGDYASTEHQNGFVPGSGLEAMDICESLFGYWPCVAKKAQLERNQCQVCSHDTTTTRVDPWKTAADYLFGSPMPYDYHSYHHHQFPYQSDQISWLQ